MKHNKILILNKRYYNIIKKLFIIFLLILICIQNFLIIIPLIKIAPLKIRKKFIDVNFHPDKVKGKYPGFNNLVLNYENDCSKYFKYRHNSKEDIVIFAYTYRPEKDFFKIFDNIIDSFKHSVPKATIATVIPEKDIDSKGAHILNKYGILLIPFKGYEDYHIVTSRYIAIYYFLKNNTDKYKKVFLSDIDDVFMFNDIFSTFSEEEIIINKQCWKFESEDCNLLFPIDEKWFNESYINKANNTFKDLELIKDISRDRINPHIINGGIIFGGINKVIEFLKIFNEYINPYKAKLFGYDQVLITLLVTKKKFESIGLKVERCTQRICFWSDVKYNINATKIIYKENMCSPIVLHKSIPNSWKI